jgi:hypothetical protein
MLNYYSYPEIQVVNRFNLVIILKLCEHRMLN